MSDPALAMLQGALQGEASATAALIDTLTPVIQARVARVLLRSSRGRDIRSDVEDFTQEVFVSLFANHARVLKGWEPSRGLSLKNYAGLIAERHSISVLRSWRRSPFAEDPTQDSDLDHRAGNGAAAAEAVESRELLVRLLDEIRVRLSPRALELFELLFVEQRSVDDVCELTGMSRDALYAWRSRLRKVAVDVRAELLAFGPGRSVRAAAPGPRAPAPSDSAAAAASGSLS